MEYNKIIGIGNTATVYEYEDNKALKLFNEGYPEEAVKREYHNAQAINNLNFSKPKAYQILNINNRNGIIYDRVQGELLLDKILEMKNLEKYADKMIELHKSILNNKVSNIISYKDYLKYHIDVAESVSAEIKTKTLNLLEQLDNGDTLCHGDFHPGNIFISDNKTTVIDFMNICKGPKLYDIARTLYLIQYTDVPLDEVNRDGILQLKEVAGNMYLDKMGVKREEIENYLEVIKVARKGEGW